VDVRYEHSAAVTAHIVNLLSADMPKAELFGKILFLIRSAMIDAQAELDGVRFIPSEN
jgi:hypothetical protein